MSTYSSYLSLPAKAVRSKLASKANMIKAAEKSHLCVRLDNSSKHCYVFSYDSMLYVMLCKKSDDIITTKNCVVRKYSIFYNNEPILLFCSSFKYLEHYHLSV